MLWGLCTARLEGRAGTRGGGLKVAARPGAGGLEALTATCSVEAGGLPGVIPVPCKALLLLRFIPHQNEVVACPSSARCPLRSLL